MQRPIDSIEMFYAHALAIEREAAERYAEFERWFEDRGEDVLAGLCRELARLERDHFHDLVGAAEGLTLPVISPGRYRWLDAGPPEAPAHELFRRAATPHQLLGIALAAERNARAFFRAVAKSSPDEKVRVLAAAMAREEGEHGRWVREALRYRQPAADWERLLERGTGPGTVSPSDS